ncbi:MAG: hypothetical protein IKB28_05300 [Clostridia bacterium]|nr:hypothetical protein [Clostridia bacterium]
MAIKMRVLCTPGKKKLVAMTQMIKQEFDLSINAADVIPPAYSCDKERLVVLAVTCKGSLKDDVRLFITELNKNRTANVALMIDGNADGDAYVRSLLEIAGTKVYPETLYINGGSLFNSKITDQEKTEILAWVNKCIESI